MRPVAERRSEIVGRQSAPRVDLAAAGERGNRSTCLCRARRSPGRFQVFGTVLVSSRCLELLARVAGEPREGIPARRGARKDSRTSITAFARERVRVRGAARVGGCQPQDLPRGVRRAAPEASHTNAACAAIRSRKETRLRNSLARIAALADEPIATSSLVGFDHGSGEPRSSFSRVASGSTG